MKLPLSHPPLRLLSWFPSCLPGTSFSISSQDLSLNKEGLPSAIVGCFSSQASYLAGGTLSQAISYHGQVTAGLHL